MALFRSGHERLRDALWPASEVVERFRGAERRASFWRRRRDSGTRSSTGGRLRVAVRARSVWGRRRSERAPGGYPLRSQSREFECWAAPRKRSFFALRFSRRNRDVLRYVRRPRRGLSRTVVVALPLRSIMNGRRWKRATPSLKLSTGKKTSARHRVALMDSRECLAR